LEFGITRALEFRDTQAQRPHIRVETLLEQLVDPFAVLGILF
jgi:hypothetical protein